MRHYWLVRIWTTLSAGGLFLGTLFFAASLTPSLLPRTYVIQGVLSGCSFAAGYGIGVFWRWLWSYMELPMPKDRTLRITKLSAAVLCALITVGFLWKTAPWQNSIRKLMQMEPVTSAHPFEVCAIALATFGLLLLLARLFRLILRLNSRMAGRFVPRRVAIVIGLAAALALSWSIVNGIVFRFALHSADSLYRRFDALIEPDSTPPASALKTGSAASLLEWDELGRAGREFVSSGPEAADIAAFSGREALEPIRVYAGLRSAETAEERAGLALAELKRAGGFERSVLIVITPTGTGWIDPAGMNSVEYLLRGDVASVALQYSYLSSPLSLFVEPDYGAEAARALFSAVYGYWTTLPKDHRPKLYLYGLSLGAMNSEHSTELFEVIGDPFNGALWSGPPFTASLWRSITAGRNAGSPAWLPQVRDGSYVRFMNQNGSPTPKGAAWGPMRIVYLQYASDPVTFFDYRSLYRRPDWMAAPRGPDVAPELRWYQIGRAHV